MASEPTDPARCPSAIVLYAYSDSLGHKVLAENYHAHLQAVGYKVEAFDVLTLESRSRFRLVREGYFRVLRWVPGIWRYLYWNWPRIPGANFVKNEIVPLRFPRTKAEVLSKDPDVIVSTHPIATAVACQLKRKGRYAGRVVVAFSDWHLQNYWLYKEVDTYLVLHEG